MAHSWLGKWSGSWLGKWLGSLGGVQPTIPPSISLAFYPQLSVDAVTPAFTFSLVFASVISVACEQRVAGVSLNFSPEREVAL